MLAPEQARIALFRISTLGQVPGGEKTDGGATECCMLASHLNDLNTPPPLGKHNIFRFLEVRDEILAGFWHVVFFTWKSRRVFVTTPAWEAAGGEVCDARGKWVR